MTTVKVMLNGAVAEFDVEPEMPLLWVLRDVLNLCGTKFGCGIGACAACTVLIDGIARRSCVTPVSAVGEAAVTTIEAVSSEGLSRLQQLWVDRAVAQCGYCQVGQILTTVALLDSNPDPDDAAIDSAFAGVLCRCGTYQRIRAAVHAAADTAG